MRGGYAGVIVLGAFLASVRDRSCYRICVGVRVRKCTITYLATVWFFSLDMISERVHLGGSFFYTADFVGPFVDGAELSRFEQFPAVVAAMHV